MSFSCTDLTKVFEGKNGSVQALADLTLHVDDHEFVAVVGPSGCGKTTLLKIIAGLSDASSGTVTFGGATPNGKIRAAVVFQEHALFPWMSVQDNVAFALEAQGQPRQKRLRESSHWIEVVGLGDSSNRYPFEISGGMQQRVNIARALIADPQVLLMDEPFGSLDAQTKIILQEELLRVWRENRKEVLYVTHDIEEAVLLADRVLVMSGLPGHIIAEFRVPFDRPRDLTGHRHKELAEIKWKIWNILGEHVRETLSVNP